ncbi:hypothetical protein MMC34_007658 [Xylographa carneopallida]|nr:hypothetical protein [Xylographa carneopallida]
MAYLAPIHRSSSVRHALKLRFLSSDEECLVVAKSNRLEIYAVADDGLELQYTRSVYGKITMLEKLRPASSATDHLFVGTDRYTYFSVSWDPTVGHLRTEKSYTDLSDKTGRDSQSQDRCLIDPSRRFMTLGLFEGILTVLPLTHKSKKKGDPESGSPGEPVPVRIPELFLRSSAFLHSRNPSSEKEKPRLALLFEDSHEKVGLKIRSLNYAAGGTSEPGSAEFIEEYRFEEQVDLGASHIIPVPAPSYGFLIIAEVSITYVDEVSNHHLIEPLKEATIFVTWAQIDGQRWLLADEYGKIYLLMLLVEDHDVVGWKFHLLGTTSRASVLVYLDAGLVFVGSHQGDSKVIRIQEKSMDVVQTLSNIAPILDFTIMDMGSRAGDSKTNEYSSGQARLVTGSGAFHDGSLRSVRSGVGLEELGNLGEMDHIVELFALRSGSETELVDMLVASFIDETRLFSFSGSGEVEEKDDYKGFVLNESTLLAVNIPQNRLLQVTDSSARLLDLESGMTIATWTIPGPQSIIAASFNQHHLALSLGGLEMVILDVSAELQVKARKSFGADVQISCIDIPAVLQNTLIIGFWRGANVSVFSLETLEEITTIRVSEDTGAVPRSVLLTQILPGHSPTLFVALADGNVVTLSYDSTNASVSGRSSTVLGTQQANFKAIPRDDNLFNVFAMCEHPSLIYGSEGRIVYSAVTAENASCVCPFDCEAYPGAIAIATPEDLKIALVDNERTTHVQTLPVGETVRRIAYSTRLKAFGLGTIKRTLKDGIEVVQSHFKLADEVVFSELDTFDLNEDELVESVVRADMDDAVEGSAERFIVGTAYLEDDHPDAVRGRIIVFEVTQDRTLRVVTEIAVKGACRALAMMNGKIVAALVKTVVIYDLEDDTLRKTASYRTATAPIDIAVTGNLIAVADIMKSMSVVEFKRGPAGEPDTLTEVARHFQTAWSTAIATVDDNTYLESDAEGNLTVLRQNVSGITADDRRRLEVTSEIRLGEMVNRIRRINVPASTDATVIPRAFLATVDGSIYLFALIRPAKQDLLMRLQGNLARHVHSPGHMPFNKYRAFRNEVREAEEPFRFVDGELLERFLNCAPEMQRGIVEGLGVEVEEVKALVEGLRRLH